MEQMDAIWLVLVKSLPLPATLWVHACPQPFHPIGVLLVLATPVKNYLKWWEFRIAINPRVGR